MSDRYDRTSRGAASPRPMARSPLHAVGLAGHLGAEVRLTPAPPAGDRPVIVLSPCDRLRAVHG